MSWYRDADKSKDLNYTAPKVSQKTLDAGGNYVSPGGAAAVDATAGSTGARTLGNGSGLGS